jgi:hypothetical protein
MNNRFGLYGVLGGLVIALLLNTLSGCASPAQAEPVRQATHVLGEITDEIVTISSALVERIEVAAKDSVEAPVPTRIERFTTGERTVEQVGDITVVTEPGEAALYYYN